MCGIVGFLEVGTPFDAADARARLGDMAGRLSHRGPDDQGIWSDEEAGIGLGHRRLSIVDLSSAGHQPMQSADGRWIIAYNGEIYNFERMRSDIDGAGHHPWRGSSDTEVLVEAIAAWGIERALRSTIGMFALAVWDRQERRLHLARDRAGEKPLYYGWSSSTLLFGSELKALRAHPAFRPKLDRSAIAAYLRFGYIPAPLSIYEGVAKLPPGAHISFGPQHRQATAQPFWTPPSFVSSPAFAGLDVAADRLEPILSDAIGLQMRADVPMGAFLSGGIDSSLIVALMQRQSARPVKTFSIGFAESEFDESTQAALVAAHLATDHRQLHVTSSDALSVVPLLPDIYDEPFADSSQIPTFLLSRMAREHVTVSLSGDAGDELFGGYARYFQARQFEQLWRMSPLWGRRMLGRALRGIRPSTLSRLGAIAPKRFAELFTGNRIGKIAGVLDSADYYDAYRYLVSQWHQPLATMQGKQSEPSGWLDDAAFRGSAPEPVSWMMATDFRTYLPDDILVKVDRAAMAASLETRVPMLDYRVIELAARIPISTHIAGGVGKRVLRRILSKYVPDALIDRPKQGFGVPIGQWLRGPLRDWAEDLLDESELEAGGYLNAQPILELWKGHQSSHADFHQQLWTILMFQAWRRTWRV